MKRIIELKPVKETISDFEKAEKIIKEFFKREIYFPLLREINEPKKVLKNSGNALNDALREGRVTFSGGKFSGKFNASISKELKDLGAIWDRKNQSWKITKSSLPRELQAAISSSEFYFKEKIAKIDERLSQILPAEFAGQIKLSHTFDRALWKTDKELKSTLKGITVAPQLTPERRKRIADEWENNLQLYIQNFAEKEIKDLRKNLKKSVFAGNRFESMISTIQKSYGVSANKAKFLARQETSLLMTKFKQARYTDSGVMKYRWGCVHRPHDKTPDKHTPGNVRYWHGILEGGIYRWDNPPKVDEQGNRKNPGQDYNCRCFARPIVEF